MSAPAHTRNALDARLAATRASNQVALVMYLTAGFPDVDSTLRWGRLLAENGAAIIELGVPFSDPLGDGPTIQRSSQRALDAGMTLRRSLELAAAIHAAVDAPIVIMSYCNPLFRMGAMEFATAAGKAGVSGVIVPDLPIEEAGPLAAALRDAGIHLIYLLSPTSTEERIRLTARAASGFIYCMALAGVTGARANLDTELPDFLRRVRALTDVPLVVGFGISRPDHIRQLATKADGAVIASALVDLVERTPLELRDAAVVAFVKELHASCSDS